MEDEMFIVNNFNSICRLCLKKDGIMSPIFDNATDGESEIPLVTQIADFIELQIHANDGLPEHICHRCLFKTEKCTKFRSQCAANDAKLRRISNIKQETHDNSSSSAEINSYGYSQQGQMEDRVVMVVDPTLDYDSSDQSDNEETEQEQNEPEAEEYIPSNESYFKNVVMCRFCDQAFTNEELCQKHEDSTHDADTPYGCVECQLTFVERPSYIQHLKTVHQNLKPYNCVECDKCFRRRSDLRKHSIVHTGVRPFQCRFCLKSFSRNTNLSKHMRIHSGQKPHVCPQCPRSFISKGDLGRHVLVHSGVKPYTCSRCPVTFGRRDKLIKHEARHGPLDTDSAEKLDGSVNGEEGMVVNVNPYQKMHENSINDDDADDFEYPRVPDHISGEGSFAAQVDCKLNEQLTSQYLNQAPIKPPPKQTPAKGKNIKCHQCPKRFSTLDTYKTHMSVHMGLRNFQCKICFKKFMRKRELDRHSTLHTGLKPYECNQCDKKFSRKDKLTNHYRTHEIKVMNMPCIECGATFAKKEALVAHLKTHLPDTVEDNNYDYDVKDGATDDEET